MPKQEKEHNWQYMGRMVELAERIMAHARQTPERRVWKFEDVAVALNVDIEDVSVACGTLNFTGEAHVRENTFFLKTNGEKLDDLD